MMDFLSDADDDLPTTKFCALADPEPANDAHHELSLAVTLVSDSNFYVGVEGDVSAGGVFVATHTPRPLGSKVDLVIALSDDIPMRMPGTVAWLREYSDANEAAPGMGVHFDELSRLDRERIRDFAKSRTPMFFDGDPAAPGSVAR